MEGEADAGFVAEPNALLARVDPRTAALSVAPPCRGSARFHFFDPDSGASLLHAPSRSSSASRDNILTALGRPVLTTPNGRLGLAS